MRKTLSPAQKKVKGSPSPVRTTRSTTSGSVGRGGSAGAGGSARRRTTTAASASKPAKPTSNNNTVTNKSNRINKTSTTSTATNISNTTSAKGQQTANKKTASTQPKISKVQVKSKLRKVIAGKVRPTSTKPLDKHKKKAIPRKQIKKEKEEENVGKEPVEVVIHVKKPKNKVIKPDTPRTGVSSGKIGKRKTTGKQQQQQEMKKKLLKKLSGKMEEKLESVVNTILEVAVVAKKVVPKGKTAASPEIIKSKIKKEKKKVKLKEELNKVEVKEEKKEKELKDSKELKEKEVKVKKEMEKKPAKEIKKEIKIEKKEIQEETKDDKEIKKEAVEPPVVEKKVKEEANNDTKEEKKVKEEKKIKESKPKTKKPKKESEDCLSKCEIEIENAPSSKNEETVVKSPISPNDVEVEQPTTPKPPEETLVKKKVKLKEDEPKKEEDLEQKKSKKSKPTSRKEKTVEAKKECDIEESKRRMKLFGFWEGPKRHREASLNALAKVHCLYENESRGAMMEMLNKAVTRPRIDKKKNDSIVIKEELADTNDSEEVNKDSTLKETSDVEEIPKRNLRSAPGMRSVGRCWDVEPLSTTSPSPSSSSSDESSDYEKRKKVSTPRTASPKEKPQIEPVVEEDSKKKEEPAVKKVRKRRKRCELMMDLKDMVVRKRMASLNASAMLAASYSMEKRSVRGDEERRRRGGNRSSTEDSSSTSMDIESSDDEVIVSGSSKKVAVIVNQDTDVTITGLYVNSTTRSTRHCSITGMQYRISSTSHTQTESTAVTTETVIHTSDHVSVSHSGSNSGETVGSPGSSCKTYTPLGALSSMQPPGGNTSNPLVRRHPCSSAFSAPPPPCHHPHQDIHGYYQPAGPLISHHHLHTSASTSSSLPPGVVSSVQATSSKGSPISGAGDTVSTSQQATGSGQPSQQQQQPPPEEYRAPLTGYPPPYSYQYLQAPPPAYHPQDCYPGYYHQKYPPNYPPRRYWPSPGASSQMVSSEPPYPPQAPLVEPYPHGPPPPPPYYYGHPPGPPATCYPHSPPGRGPLPPGFMEPPFPTCPCPMQPCPKNVHTGPLTGASKGSGQLVQAQTQQAAVVQQPIEVAPQQVPLQPVVLPLPPEPSGAIIGPPSPARGSAGMPPPASPALSSTARNPHGWSPTELLINTKPDPSSDDECCRNRLHAENVDKDVKHCEKTDQNASISPPPVHTVVELPPISETTVNTARRARPAVKRKSMDSENVELVGNRQTSETSLVSVSTAVPATTATITTTVISTTTTAPPAKRRRTEVAPCGPTEPVVTRGQAKKIRKYEPLKPHRRLSKSSNKTSATTTTVEPKKQIRKKPPPTPPPRPPTPVQHAVISQKVNGVRQRKESHIKNKKSKSECKKENGRRRSSSTLEENSVDLLAQTICRTQPTPKWSNGWSWDGEPFTAKVFLTSDDNPVFRKCYPAMRHIEGDVIHPKDCVLLRSGPRKQLPYIAKVAAMWDNPEDGEMMVSLLWYYRPEHTEQGRNPSQPLDEIFASRHKDTNSVACIEDKCYVLTYNEYCRYKKSVCMSEAGIVKPRSVVPKIEDGFYPRVDRLPPGQVASDIVFFCRKVYDFRQRRILKNPPLLNNNYNNITHN